jgi:hypothetical protein
MRLWLLQPRPDVLAREAHPWEPPEDKVMGLVVRAPDASDARSLAQARAGYEGAGLYRQFGAHEDEIAEGVWLDPAWTSCQELESEGDADRHWRDRYSSAGKSVESRLKRRGIGAQQLRSDAALVIEWFRLCLRHGWLGSARRREPGELRMTSGIERLKRTLEARKKRRLNRPYGRAAIKLGLARAGPSPP